MKWILLTLLLSQSILASDFIRANGKFVAEDQDSYDFIQKQLIHVGFLDLIDKKLDQLGLNKELFWQKYNEGLNQNYTKIEEDLKAKLKITESSSTSDKAKFDKLLRNKKFEFREKFARINSAITRFVIKKKSRSQNYPRNRYITLEGTVNSSVLNKIYYKFVSGTKSSEYGSFFINVDYQLDGVTFSDLGVENENEFSNVITEKWIEWFQKNKPANVSNVRQLNEENKDQLRELQKISSEELMGNIPSAFVNSLMLDVQIQIIREKFDKKKNQYEFQYQGSAYLKDLQTGLVVDTYELDDQLKVYNINESISLANIIVNHVYTMALGTFPQVVSSVRKMTTVNSIQKIAFVNFPNIEQIYALIDLIKERGIKYSLKVTLGNITRERAEVFCFYDGSVSELKGLINSLKSAKKGLEFDIVEQGTLLSIKYNVMERTSSL